MATTENGVTSWKHIGLHGHSVGSFSVSSEGLQWRSAILGRDDGSTSTTRNIPKSAIQKAQYTVFGKSLYLRIATKSEEGKNKLHHEMRFDGFPPGDAETLKELFQDNFGMELQKHSISAAGTQYGLSKINGKKLTFSHCVLEDADEEGEEFEIRKGDESELLENIAVL